MFAVLGDGNLESHAIFTSKQHFQLEERCAGVLFVCFIIRSCLLFSVKSTQREDSEGLELTVSKRSSHKHEDPSLALSTRVESRSS